MILFTVVRSARFESQGTTCHGLYRDRQQAQDLMEKMAADELREDETYDDEEIEEYMDLDNIDTPAICYHVASIYPTDEGMQPGQIL